MTVDVSKVMESFRISPFKTVEGFEGYVEIYCNLAQREGFKRTDLVVKRIVGRITELHPELTQENQAGSILQSSLNHSLTLPVYSKDPSIRSSITYNG